MTPSPATADALLLGIWHADGRAALTGALRDWQGETVPDVLALTGQPWTVPVQALTEAERIDAGHILILSNDADLVRALSPPFRPPAPSRKERVFIPRIAIVNNKWTIEGWDYSDVGVGASDGEGAAHWQALCLLGGRWGGRFRAMQVDDLPKARELWAQC